MEPTPSQITDENCYIDVPLSSGYPSENYNHGYLRLTETSVRATHPSDFSLPGVIPCPHQHQPQPAVVDSHCSSYRFHCPYEGPGPQCQSAPHVDYLLKAQPGPYHFLTGAVPGLSDTGYHSSGPAPWLTEGSIHCGMMPGEMYNVVASICPPETMDNQQCQEVLTERRGPDRPLTMCLQPINPVGENNTYHQISHLLYSECRIQAVDGQSKDPAAQTKGTVCDSKSKRPCNCTKSQCLKLYCNCFANGELCCNCNCFNCYNNLEHDSERHNAMKVCLDRNPEAFRSKIASGKSGEVKGRHKGCKCKRSCCLKNYCECYEANIMCSSSCKCVGCKNYDDRAERRPGVRDCPGVSDCPDTCLYGTDTHTDKDKYPLLVITPAVVEDTCHCLVEQAEDAEKEGHSLALAERMVLEEFGHCLTQISKSIFKATTY